MKRFLTVCSIIGTIGLLSGCQSDNTGTSPVTPTPLPQETLTPTAFPEQNTQSQTNLQITFGNELSSQEAAKYRSDLPVTDRIILAAQLASQRPKNGFNQMRNMFSDLEKYQDIADNAQNNILNMGPETWYYSKEADITIIVDNNTNAPIFLLKGKNPPLQTIQAAARAIQQYANNSSSSQMMNRNLSETSEDGVGNSPY